MGNGSLPHQFVTNEHLLFSRYPMMATTARCASNLVLRVQYTIAVHATVSLPSHIT